MAINLKGLFSKLKPAAKTIANYGDDAAKALTTYGDDIVKQGARSLPTVSGKLPTGDALEDLYRYQMRYQDPVPAPVDDIIDDIYLASSGKSYRANADPELGISMLTDRALANKDAYARTFKDSDWTLSTDYWGRQHPVRKDDLAEYLSLEQLDPDAYKSGLPATPAEWGELTNSLNNLEIMDDIDTTLQFGNPISNFSNTSSYIDQMVSPTPGWTSRWGELERHDPRLQSLYDQLRENFDTWTDFESNFGFTPSHVDTGNLADQIIKLEKLRHSKRW